LGAQAQIHEVSLTGSERHRRQNESRSPDDRKTVGNWRLAPETEPDRKTRSRKLTGLTDRAHTQQGPRTGAKGAGFRSKEKMNWIAEPRGS
jgi:hypothetical protein